MDGTLVAPPPATEPTESHELVRQLGREVLELRQEVHELRRDNAVLRRDNAELRQQAGYWKAMHARAVQRADQLEADLEQLRGENRKLQAQLFGRKSETASSQDRSNHLQGELDQAPSTPPKRGQRKDRPGPSRRDYSHLPVVEEPRELPEARRVCPRCGAALVPSDTEDSEQIEIDVRAYRRLIRRRRYQRTCTCADCPRTVTAPPAPQLIPKGL
jgi:transposase